MKLLNITIALVGIGGTLSGAFWFMEYRHVSQCERIIDRMAVLDRDIKKDAEARHHYNELKLEGDAAPADLRRLEYLESQLELKYQDQAQNRAGLDDCRG